MKIIGKWLILILIVYLPIVQATALHKAAESGNLAMVTKLIADGVDINTRTPDFYRLTALHRAAWFGHTDVANALLSARAEIDAKDGLDRTALWLAVKQEHVDLIHVLLSAGANGELKHVDLIDVLLSAGAKVLHKAAESGNLAIVTKLIADGVDINGRTPDRYSWTALHRAAWFGHTDVVNALLSARAEIDAKDGLDETALETAVEQEHLDIIHVLLCAGANGEQERVDVIHVLLSAGANLANLDRLDVWERSEAGKTFAYIKKWSIENQIQITNKRHKEKLDENRRGSYVRQYNAYGKKIRKALRESDLKTIPYPYPTSIIDEYLGFSHRSRRTGLRPRKRLITSEGSNGARDLYTF